MKRLLLNDLKNWRYAQYRKPILLRGARQVGKTHLVRQLGLEFPQFIEINFEKTPELINLFNHDLNPQRIVKELSVYFNKQITPEQTLLFFDEIQAAPQAIIAMRYFYEEMPELHLIGAGSLVDFAIDQVGVPVGRIQFLYLYPMSFIEFLCASNQQLLALEIVQHSPEITLSDAIHQKALKHLGEYIAIGGMPEAVYQWITYQDISLSSQVLHSIKNAYEQDFSKYAKKHETKYVELLYKKIPTLICQHFKYTHLNTDYRKRELEPALHLLEKAGIIHPIYKTLGNGIPLGAQTDFQKFKLIVHDIGLTQAMLGLELKSWILDPIMSMINKGVLTESYVGQEILAYSNPNTKQNLYYWHREQKSSQAEVDYLLSQEQHIIPIEVKSGHGSTLQSMRLFLDFNKQSPYGIRFSTNNYSSYDRICSYPLYAVAGAINHHERLIQYIKST